MRDNLGLLVRSGHRVILMETADEPSAVEAAGQLATGLGWPLLHWSITTGLAAEGAGYGSVFVVPNQADAALIHVRDAEGPAVYVFKDFGPHVGEPYVRRLLRDLSGRRDGEGPEFALVLVESSPLPESARRFTVPFAVKMPDAEELERVARETYREIRSGAWWR